ncbi:hypothetical protein DPMN_162558 [Dreissena polymorpha]|uniref:Uncharacterized protein n=1 Tax=Dreissena polymorpha TaxID=45954 RepID=A0A9D4ERW1_DREPO|nr:hypothetical protein DPMN_162558 [Dreissena polymorpha]
MPAKEGLAFFIAKKDVVNRIISCTQFPAGSFPSDSQRDLTTSSSSRSTHQHDTIKTRRLNSCIKS